MAFLKSASAALGLAALAVSVATPSRADVVYAIEGTNYIQSFDPVTLKKVIFLSRAARQMALPTPTVICILRMERRSSATHQTEMCWQLKRPQLVSI